jgi:hypothetical protein
LRSQSTEYGDEPVLSEPVSLGVVEQYQRAGVSRRRMRSSRLADAGCGYTLIIALSILIHDPSWEMAVLPLTGGHRHPSGVQSLSGYLI